MKVNPRLSVSFLSTVHPASAETIAIHCGIGAVIEAFLTCPTLWHSLSFAWHRLSFIAFAFLVLDPGKI